MDPRMPLGAQLIPVLVLEPHLPNEQVWSTRWQRGVWLCGITAWKRLTGARTRIA